MRLLTLALLGTTTLFVGTASAAVSSTSQPDMATLTAVSVADQTMTARQGRGGHDDTGRGGDNNPGDDDLVVIG